MSCSLTVSSQDSPTRISSSEGKSPPSQTDAINPVDKGSTKTDGNPSAKPSIAPEERQIQAWIEQLQSDSYASRRLAYQLLEPHPEIAIKYVREAMDRVDQDAAILLVRLLSEWSVHPDEGYGVGAFNALQEIAKGGVSTKSSLAVNAISSLSIAQAVETENRLIQLNAKIGRETVQIVTSSRMDQYILRLDDSFRGTAEDLTCVRWLQDTQMVRLDGNRIDRSWLEKIVTIPNLRILQIRHASITNEDINVLRSIKSLETLEIIYTPIDDLAIESLGKLPLWGTMRLFGTKISEEGIDRLKTVLEGATIIHGRGGFLGIGSTVVGLDITQVTPDSAAEKGGIRIGDRILSVEGKSLSNFNQLRDELAKFAPGDRIIVEVERIDRMQDLDGKRDDRRARFKLPVILGEQP